MAATLDQDIKREIAKLHDRGMPAAEIARQLDVGHAAVHNHIRAVEAGRLRAVVGDPLTRREIDALTFHPFCCFLPPLPPEELAALGASIRTLRAQQPSLPHKILVWRGTIIDGRNRFLACRDAGVELGPADFVVFEGDEDHAFALSLDLNDLRRHLDKSQRAIVAAKRAEHLHGRGVVNARAVASGELDVSEGYVADASRIIRRDPEVAARVEAGDLTIPAAKRELGLAAPAPKGRTRVNGVEQDDTPGVADRRARGHIPGGVLVDLRVPAAATTLASVREEHEERAAIRDQDSDETWVESRQLFKKLEGSRRDDFARAAIARRRCEAAIAAFKRAMADALPGNRRSPPWARLFERAFRAGAPDDWDFCSSEDGGCDGSGVAGFMDDRSPCPVCYGAGYVLKK